MRRALLLVALAACKSGAREARSVVIDAAAAITAVASPDAAPPSHVAALVDAFEREPDAKVRVGLSTEISREDAVAGGVQDRVIALVRAYATIPDGDWTASGLMISLAKGEAPPPRAVGDLVLELAEHGGDHTKFVAFYAVRKMRDRLPDVCAVMAKLADTPYLPDAVDTVAVLADACVPNLDPLIDALLRTAEAEQFEIEHFMAARVLAQNTPLTRAQRDRLARTARAARKHARHGEAGVADALIRQVKKLR